MSIFTSFSSLIGGKQKEPKTSSPVVNSKTSQKKIVIVEDDTELRNFYEEYLTSENFQVITAENGQLGLEAIKANDPDIVLLDLMMPVMDGKTVLHTIRNIPQFKYTPVVILSNAGDADTIQQTKVFDNADDFLIKANITPDILLNKIKSLTYSSK